MTTEFRSQRLSGARFRDVHLDGASFEDVTLRGARFREVDLCDIRVDGAWMSGAVINGELDTLNVNGVEVMGFVEAELDRRHPDRPLMRPTDADGFRAAWAALERLWGQTVQHARSFAPEQLHESVDGEWSFIETLRHLVFATDAWVCRAVLGQPAPWHPLDLPHDIMADEPSVPRDRTARPSLEEVLALRADRMAIVREVLAGLTDEGLAGMTTPVTEPGYPQPESFPVRRCLGAVINEEWEHRLYAERDLAALADRAAGRTAADTPDAGDEAG